MRQAVALETPNDVVVCQGKRRPDVGTYDAVPESSHNRYVRTHAMPQPVGNWATFHIRHRQLKQLLTVFCSFFSSVDIRGTWKAIEFDKWRSANTQALLTQATGENKSKSDRSDNYHAAFCPFSSLGRCRQPKLKPTTYGRTDKRVSPTCLAFGASRDLSSSHPLLAAFHTPFF